MKTKNKLFFLMLVSALFIGFTACSDDDDDDKNNDPDLSAVVKGDYEGSIIFGGNTIKSGVEIVLQAKTKTTANLILDEELPVIGSLKLECPVNLSQGSGSTYNVTGETKTDLGENKDVAVSVKGSITEKGEIELQITVGEGDNAMDITYKGSKDGEEDDDDLSEAIEGKYEGVLIMGGNPIAEDVIINVASKTATIAVLTLNQEMPVVGELAIECDVDIELTDDSMYAISGTTTVNVSIAGTPARDYDVTVTGEISEEGVAEIEIKVGAILNVTYKGTKEVKE